MNISDIASLNASLSSLSVRQSGGARDIQTDPVSIAVQQANLRVEQQLQSTEVKLSSLGQFKSAVASLETASAALSDNKTSESAATAKTAALNFVNAFNNANKVASTVTNGELANDGRSRVAANEISRAISSSPSTAAELKAIGITTENGTLKLDAQKLEQAFQSNPTDVAETLANAGQQVERIASRQIENNGNVARSISTLNTQQQQLETQQAAQQNLVDILQRATDDAMSRLNATNAAGIAAYQRIFNL